MINNRLNLHLLPSDTRKILVVQADKRIHKVKVKIQSLEDEYLSSTY